MSEPLTKADRERLERYLQNTRMVVDYNREHLLHLMGDYEATVKDLEQRLADCTFANLDTAIELTRKDAAGRALAQALKTVIETDFTHPSIPVSEVAEHPDACVTCEALAACPPEWKEQLWVH